ncbi:hypothetical protein CRE_06188 [Caenorhabditis remanei]|uniref:Uncharacterized protein n=1 Tax=Caenorhabditis remanei TaxID=31234 RepID=E3NL34_CAERE|nr:hypothetical protein CRE_06188 [Caenorhabditis remanei]
MSRFTEAELQAGMDRVREWEEVLSSSKTLEKYLIPREEWIMDSFEHILQKFGHVRFYISVMAIGINTGSDLNKLLTLEQQIEALGKLIECLEEDLKGNPSNEIGIKRAIMIAQIGILKANKSRNVNELDLWRDIKIVVVVLVIVYFFYPCT